MPKIYESPDKGKTVYERDFGAPHSERKLIMSMMYPSNDADYNRMTVLLDEIEILRRRIKPQATGHLYTAISVLQDRVQELEKKYKGCSEN